MRPRSAARTRRRRGSRLPALGLATTLLLGGGTALVTAAFAGGRAAAATSPSTTTTTTTTTTTPAAGASGAGGAGGTSLGGFTVTALAEAVTAQYEQPNLPLPSDPSLEFDEGYAATTDNFGPTGTATASTFYPGQVVANAGPELSLLVPGVPLPAAPVWPVEAVSSFPQTPNTASDDQPGANMDATSGTDANMATATMGNDVPDAGSPGTTTTTTSPGGGNPLGSSSTIVAVAGSSGTSTSEAPSTEAIGTATATDTGISVLGGLIAIGGVTSTATATSDGTTGTVTGSTEVTNASIAGEPVTIDASGIHAAGQSNPLAIPISTLDSLLTQLGISVSLTAPTDTVLGASASRTLDGLKITINLDTLDNSAGQIGSLLPASLTSQLPVPLPNKQLLTLDFGTVTVDSAASPAFAGAGPSDGGSGVAAGGGEGGFAAPVSTGVFDASDGVGDPGTTGTGTTAAGAPSSAPAAGSQPDRPTSALTPVFTGLGAGLVLLGLLAALGLAYAYKRVDDLSELAGPACASGDPLLDRFDDADGTIDEWGEVGS